MLKQPSWLTPKAPQGLTRRLNWFKLTPLCLSFGLIKHRLCRPTSAINANKTFSYVRRTTDHGLVCETKTIRMISLPLHNRGSIDAFCSVPEQQQQVRDTCASSHLDPEERAGRAGAAQGLEKGDKRRMQNKLAQRAFRARTKIVNNDVRLSFPFPLSFVMIPRSRIELNIIDDIGGWTFGISRTT